MTSTSGETADMGKHAITNTKRTPKEEKLHGGKTKKEMTEAERRRESTDQENGATPEQKQETSETK